MGTRRYAKTTAFRRVTLTTLLCFCSWWAVACSAPAGLPGAASAVDKPLADSGDPGKLAQGWSWNQGESQESAFQLAGGALTITAGPKTEQWGKTNSAPYVAYDLEGDFAAQTKLDFGDGPVSYWAGIGIMSADDPSQWVRVAPRGQKALGLIRNSGREITATADFPLTSVYLKIQRRGEIISGYYSKDGAAWLPVSENYEYALSPKVRLYLTAQNARKAIRARFSEVKVTPL